MADETTDASTAEESEPAGPALSAEHQALLARLEADLGDALVESAPTMHDLVVRIRPDAWRRAAQLLHDRYGFDYLSFVSGIDWMPAPLLTEEGSGDTSSPVQPRETTYGAGGSAGRFQVFAHVESTRGHVGVTLKTDVDDSDPRAESWVDVYPGADWHERECWEMFGIAFDGHPNLRRIYLPAEFEGHPLRKDFPLLSREVKPWPGLVDVEGMPGDAAGAEEGADA